MISGWIGPAAPPLRLDRRLEDGARLHLGDLRIRDGEPAAAKAQHGVDLMQFRGPALQLVHGGPDDGRDLPDFVLGMGQELVQRRIEQPDRDRQPAHDREQIDEVGALHRQELLQRRAPARFVVGQDHLAHGDDAVALEKHMLGAAEADALGPEGPRRAGVARRVGVGANLESARRVGPTHQGRELARERGLQHLDLADEHLPGRAVERDDDRPSCGACAGDGHRLRRVVDADRARAGDAGLAHAARHHRRVRGHAAARGQDALARRACRGCPRARSRRAPG